MEQDLSGAAAASERRAFSHYSRTGIRVVRTDDEAGAIETKFNPHHDPRDGRFTSGAGGSATSHKPRSDHGKSAAGGQRSASAMSDAQIRAHAAHAMEQYHAERARGMNPEEAAAWAANSEAESGGNPQSLQPHGPGRGLFQWGADRPAADRRIAFRQFAGIPIERSTAGQQRDFRDWELRHRLE